MPQHNPPAGEGRYSQRVRRGEVPPDSVNGRFLAAVRAELTEQLGGEPLTATQRMMIERAAWLKLHCALFDETIGDSHAPLNNYDRRSYLAFSNSLTRALKALGIPRRPVGRPPKQHQPTVALTDILNG